MRGPQSTVNGGTTNAVENMHGPGIHGFTNGDVSTYDDDMDANANGTEWLENWGNDLVANIKFACIEGNGEFGPLSDDADDDPYELAAAVNTAANVLTGESSFVASGLEFTTSTLSLTVTLSSGIYVFEGRKYHATDAMLDDVVVQVDGDDAGNGSSFTLLASRDHYIFLGPDESTEVGGTEYETPQRTVSFVVSDVANGAAFPGFEAGHFPIAMIATDGTGVPLLGVTHIDHCKTIAGNDGQGLLRLRYLSPGTVLEPYDFQGGASLGSRASFDSTEALGGNFWNILYVEEVEIRSYTDSGHTGDRTSTWSDRTSTAGAANATMDVLDLDDYPNSSVVEIEVTVTGRSHLNQFYTRTFRQMASKTSAGVMGLAGTLREISVDDPGALGCTAIFIATAEGDNSLVQIRVTGAAANNIEWTARITTVESWGS